MVSLAILVATASVGVDYGWQPGSDGRMEYLIQIEPVLLQTLADGEEIVSEIHPDVDGVRRFRIRVGSGALPRLGAVPKKPASDPSGGRFPDIPPLTKPADKPPVGGGEFPGISRPGDLPKTDGGNTSLPPIPTLPDNGAGALKPADKPVDLDPPGPATAHQRAEYIESTQPSPGDGNQEANKESAAPVVEAPAPSKPWLPLVLTVLLLFASIGLNAYLGWLAWGFYQRMRSMTADLGKSPVGSV